jgi:hypothetical protein
MNALLAALGFGPSLSTGTFIIILGLWEWQREPQQLGLSSISEM